MGTIFFLIKTKCLVLMPIICIGDCRFEEEVSYHMWHAQPLEPGFTVHNILPTPMPGNIKPHQVVLLCLCDFFRFKFTFQNACLSTCRRIKQSKCQLHPGHQTHVLFNVCYARKSHKIGTWLQLHILAFFMVPFPSWLQLFFLLIGVNRKFGKQSILKRVCLWYCLYLSISCKTQCWKIDL